MNNDIFELSGNKIFHQYDENGQLYAEFGSDQLNTNNGTQQSQVINNLYNTMLKDRNNYHPNPFAPYDATEILSNELNNANFRNESYDNSQKNRTFVDERGIDISPEGATNQRRPSRQEFREEVHKLGKNNKCSTLRKIEIFGVFCIELFDKFPHKRSLTCFVNAAMKSLNAIRQDVQRAYIADKSSKSAKLRYLRRAKAEYQNFLSIMGIFYDLSQRPNSYSLIAPKQMRHIVDEVGDIEGKISNWIRALNKS